MAAPMEHTADVIHFPIRSGASLTAIKPVFSFDNKYLFVGSADVIKVFSTASGECYRELIGHEKNVTSIVLHPKHKLQILSCSEDKTVILWDYTDGIQLKTYLIGKPVLGIFTTGLENSVLLLAKKNDRSSGDDCDLLEKSLINQESKPNLRYSPCPKDVNKFTIGPKGHFCASFSNTTLKVQDLRRKDRGPVTHRVESTQSFTCITCHPDGGCLATGSLDGTIYLWYEFLQTNAVKTKLHWHNVAVKEITFTPEGSYLLSGGHECVLVKWHHKTEYRDFLPRLGAPINKIVCSGDNHLYAICLDDNVIQVVTSSFVIQQVYQGLTRLQGSSMDTGLKCDPRTSALVLNGKPGHIQFYCVHEDKQLFNLDIVNQNYVSPESLDKPLAQTKVTHVEFDQKGQWLTTVEYWNDGEMSPEIRLKFWIFDEENQNYLLNTTVEQAHSEKICFLEFRPQCLTNEQGPQPMVVTTGKDGHFKLWTLTDDSDIYRENVKWTCQSVGFYRGIPAWKTSFSEDGTLLAVVFDNCITLWDPDSNLLRETLLGNGQQARIEHILFGSHTCSQYLVSCTKTILTVWNLINCSISWSADCSIVSLTKDPLSDIMAAFSSDKQLHVFRPADPSPVFVGRDVSENAVKSSVFIPHSHSKMYRDTLLSWQKYSDLYFMDNKQQMYSVSLKGQNRRVKSTDDTISIEENLPQSALSLIMKGHTNKSGLRVEQKQVTLQPQDRYFREILGSPAHVQPSVSTLCQPFIKSLLIPLKKSRDQDDDNDDTTEHTENSQTVSLDSGLDSDDPDEETHENQSTDGQSKIDIKTGNLTEKKILHVTGEKSRKTESRHLEEMDSQDYLDLHSVVFKKSLDWYSDKIK